MIFEKGEVNNSMKYVFGINVTKNKYNNVKCEFTIPPSARIIEVLFFKYKVKKK